MPDARYAEIDAPEAIADVFIELTRNIHEVTLRFDGTLIHYPISVMSVDRTLGQCLLDITSIGDVEHMLTEQRAFSLHARRQAAALQSSLMHPREVLHRSARLGIRCNLPEHVSQVKKRGYFRAALREGMAVAVMLYGPAGAQWCTTLRDLSIGGCLLSLPLGQEKGITQGADGYRIVARFPNGETFEAASHVSHMVAEPEAGLFHIGIAFDIGLEKESREVWLYVREVEREVARQAALRPEMRPLAPSRLFSGDPDLPA